MDYYIREATAEDGEEKGYVHFTSWKETYEGLMPKEYLDNIKLDRCIDTSQKHYENTLVSIVNNKVVGFVGYLEDARDHASIKQSSEIMAIYLLEEYQKKGIGYSLMMEALKRVTKDKIVLFVLKGNEKAIRFYKKIGFQFTGHKIIQQVTGGQLIELEMFLILLT